MASAAYTGSREAEEGGGGGGDAFCRQRARKSCMAGDQARWSARRGGASRVIWKMTRMGCTACRGGTTSAISITLMPNAQMSTCAAAAAPRPLPPPAPHRRRTSPLCPLTPRHRHQVLPQTATAAVVAVHMAHLHSDRSRLQMTWTTHTLSQKLDMQTKCEG